MEVKSTTSLDQALVNRIVSSITANVPTDSIYIFGSYARKEERPDSDVDIYIVTSSNEKRHHEYVTDARVNLLWMPLAIDVLSQPTTTFDMNSKSPMNVEWYVLNEGVKIYEQK